MMEIDEVITIQNKYKNSIVFFNSPKEFIDKFNEYNFLISSIVDKDLAVILEYDSQHTFVIPEHLFEFIIRNNKNTKYIMNTKYCDDITCYSYFNGSTLLKNNGKTYIIYKSIFAIVCVDQVHKSITLTIDNNSVDFPLLKDLSQKSIYNFVIQYINDVIVNKLVI